MAVPERAIINDIIERSLRPSAGTWMKHLGFLLLTLLTTTIAGVLYPFGLIPVLPEGDPQTWPEIVQFIVSLPAKYLALVGTAVSYLLTRPDHLRYGLSFSLSLLFILISHEMGHYVACRLYNVDATLPFFIPTPPMIGPAGTFGAFIKIRSPMPSRRAVFDIGVAGPIAGFITLLPIAVLGIVTMEQATPEQIANASGIVFSHPFLMQLIAAAAGIDLAASIENSYYYA